MIKFRIITKCGKIFHFPSTHEAFALMSDVHGVSLILDGIQYSDVRIDMFYRTEDIHDYSGEEEQDSFKLVDVYENDIVQFGRQPSVIRYKNGEWLSAYVRDKAYTDRSDTFDDNGIRSSSITKVRPRMNYAELRYRGDMPRIRKVLGNIHTNKDWYSLIQKDYLKEWKKVEFVDYSTGDNFDMPDNDSFRHDLMKQEINMWSYIHHNEGKRVTKSDFDYTVDRRGFNINEINILVWALKKLDIAEPEVMFITEHPSRL